ncbi:MAG: CHAT domain-containing protein [Calditrichaeota bacterium]|nr:MAG: CHAT domain-containing protein [Calditrichota bacterium]
MNKIKILFLAANPQNTPQLRLDEEIRAITEKIRASDYRDSLELVSVWAVHPDDLLQSLNEHKPHIVHFSGHGSTKGEIVLVDREQQPKPVRASALKALFTTLKDNIQIVVLNACYSRLQAEGIAEVIDYVIGMRDTIGDKAAIIFAASFYRAIGFNRTVQEAFDQARTALLLEGIPEEDTPEFLVRPGINPSNKLIADTRLLNDKDERTLLREELMTHRKNLRRLQLQLAQWGELNAPIRLFNEIEYEEAKIKELEQLLSRQV